MAVADEVVVEFRADTASYISNIVRAEQTFSQKFEAMQREAKQLGNAVDVETRQISGSIKQMLASIEISSKQTAAAIDQVATRATRAGQATERGANNSTRALRQLHAANANIAAQFQDIGVQLASGTSPFTIIAQQVPQITAGATSLTGVLRGAGVAMAQLVSPVGLASTAFILAAGVAVNYFMDLLDYGADSEETLKKQADLIGQVADKWGDALPEVKAYADELQRAAEAQKIIDATKGTLDKLFAQANLDVIALASDIGEVIENLRAMGASDAAINRVMRAFGDLRQAVEDQKGVTEANIELSKALSEAYTGDLTPALFRFVETLKNLAEAWAKVDRSADAARDSQEKALLGTVGGQSSTGGPARYRQPGDIVDLPDSAPAPTRREDPYFAEAEKQRRRQETPQEKFQDSLDDHRRRIELLKAELAAQGQLAAGYNDYGFAVAKAREEQRLLAAAQQAGLEITPALASSISEAATELATLEAALKSNAKAQDELNKKQKEFNDFSKSTLSGFISDMARGKSAAEALASALQKVADKLLEIAFNALFDEGGPFSSLGGILNSLLGGSKGGGKAGGIDPWSGLRTAASAASSIASAPASAVKGTGSAVDLASGLLGFNETANAGSINTFLKAGGIDLKAAQTAWCAAFVNSSLKQIGVDGTGSLTANSFLNWGAKIDPSAVMKGDVLVQSNGFGIGQTGGHVGFATGATRMGARGMQLEMLSGNSGRLGEVDKDWVDAVKVDVRRATEGAVSMGDAANQAASNVSGMGQQAAVATEGLGQMSQGLSNFVSQLTSGAGGAGGFGFGGLLQTILGVGGGPMGGIGTSLHLLDDGGYTGPGNKHDPAGIVHKGEVVFSQEDVARNGGVAFVEAIRKHGIRRGYAEGGEVRGPHGPSADLFDRGRRMPRMSMARREDALSVVYAPSWDARGADKEAIARLERLRARDRAELPSLIVKTVKQAQSNRYL